MYLIDPNGNYPMHAGDLVAAHPDWTEGSALPEGWQEVAPGKTPDIDHTTQAWTELAPALVKGKLTRQFQVRDLTTKELEQRAAAVASLTNDN